MRTKAHTCARHPYRSSWTRRCLDADPLLCGGIHNELRHSHVHVFMHTLMCVCTHVIMSTYVNVHRHMSVCSSTCPLHLRDHPIVDWHTRASTNLSAETHVCVLGVQVQHVVCVHIDACAGTDLCWGAHACPQFLQRTLGMHGYMHIDKHVCEFARTYVSLVAHAHATHIG